MDYIERDVQAEAHAHIGRPREYGYAPSVYYRLEHNGKALLPTATEGECWRYIHRHSSCSVDWALRHEGWRMVPVTLDREGRQDNEHGTLYRRVVPTPVYMRLREVRRKG